MIDRPVFQRRWFMWDLARQRTFDRGEFLDFLDGLQRLNYNGLGLYLEGAFSFDAFPGLIRDGILGPGDVQWLMEECAKRNIFLFPMTNVVGHMEHFFQQERFRPLLMEGTTNQLNFLDPSAEAFVMTIVREYAKHFPCGMVHIGGDEVHLTDENKISYAKFLAKICDRMLSEGIRPAIWNDMLWMNPELCQYFSRDVFIFDWSYYGHRPEGMAYFRDLGFRDIVVCPCDNSWEGFIHYQRLSGHLKSRTDMPVRPDEVEALFEDATNEGISGGCLTNWENTRGRVNWAQWSAFARAALYMNGQLEAREVNDEKIELALFGRVTPYTQVSRILQDELPMRKLSMAMRNALYVPKEIRTLFHMARDGEAEPVYDYSATAEKVEALLTNWQPASSFEQRCKSAMYGICGMLRASSALLDAFLLLPHYTQAAEIQFQSPSQAALLLQQVTEGFRRAVSATKTYQAIHESVISGSGHTRNDLLRLTDTIRILNTVIDLLLEEANRMDRIPLLRFDILLNRAINGDFHGL